MPKVTAHMSMSIDGFVAVQRQGGTSSTFVTGGLEEAVGRARETAGDRHINIAAGAHVVRDAIAVHLLDELDLHVVPLLLSEGVELFENAAMPARTRDRSRRPDGPCDPRPLPVDLTSHSRRRRAAVMTTSVQAGQIVQPQSGDPE